MNTATQTTPTTEQADRFRCEADVPDPPPARHENTLLIRFSLFSVDLLDGGAYMYMESLSRSGVPP